MSESVMDGRQAVCHHTAFSVLLACSRACIIPFMTIYFRQLGLNALQTGVVFSTQYLIRAWWSPIWMHTAIRLNKRRCLLIFALFIAAVSPLAITYVPSVQPQSHKFCVLGHDLDTTLQLGSKTTPGTNEPTLSNKISLETSRIPINVSKSTLSMITTTPSDTSNNENQTSQEDNSDESSENSGSSGSSGSSGISESSGEINTSIEDKFTDDEIQFLLTRGISMSTINNMKVKRVKSLIESYLKKTKENKNTTSEMNIANDHPTEDSADIGNSNTVNSVPETPKIQLTSHLKYKHHKNSMLKQKKSYNNGNNRETQYFENKNDVRRVKRSLEFGNNNSSSQVHNETIAEIPHTKNKALRLANALGYHIRSMSPTLFFIFVIIIGSEFVSLPIERFVSALWVNYLDKLDAKSVFQGETFTSVLPYAILPLLTSYLVVQSDCILPYTGASRYSIYIYMSVIFTLLTSLLAFCYPIVVMKKQTLKGDAQHLKMTNNHQGQHIMFFVRDPHLTVFTISSMLLAFVNTSTSAFLFWYIYDLGGDEVTMAATVTSSAICQLVFMYISHSLIKWFGNYGSMCFALICCCIKFAGYAMFTSPVVIIALSSLSGLQSTFSEGALFTHPELKNRRSRVAISHLEQGFSYVTGYLLFGFLYHRYSSSIVFTTASIICAVWILLFTCIMQVCKQSEDKERYIRLLQDSDDDDEDDIWPKTMKDDWLEKATKK